MEAVGSNGARLHAPTLAPTAREDGGAPAGAPFDLVESCPDAKTCPAILALAWSPDGDAVATARKDVTSVTVWDVKKRVVRSTLAESQSLDMNVDRASLAWSEQGILLMPQPGDGGSGAYASGPEGAQRLESHEAAEAAGDP